MALQAASRSDAGRLVSISTAVFKKSACSTGPTGAVRYIVACLVTTIDGWASSRRIASVIAADGSPRFAPRPRYASVTSVSVVERSRPEGSRLQHAPLVQRRPHHGRE